MALRLRGTKTELEEAGEDTDGMADSVSQLQAKLKALTHGKVDIMADADTYKNTTQILREMSAAWEEMTDKERAAALELMGGKRQANILASVIKNFDTVEEVIQTSTNSQGSALKENEKYLDSIQGRMDQFSNTLQTFWMNMIDSDVIKGFVQFGTNAVKFLDTIPGKITAITAAIAALAKFKGINLFQTMFKDIPSSIKYVATANTTLKNLQTTAPVAQSMPTTQIQAYANAVQMLTAKQQANMLAASGLNQEQIRLALSFNNVSDAAIKEAMSQGRAAFAKKEVLATESLLNVQKNLAMANSIRTQAQTMSEADKVKMLAVANEIVTRSSEELTAAKIQEMMASQNLSNAVDKEATAKKAMAAASGVAAAAKKGAESVGMLSKVGGLFSKIGSGIAGLFKAHPLLMILSLLPTVISIGSKIAESFKSSESKMKDLQTEFDELENKVSTARDNFTQLKSSADSVIPKFIELAKGVDEFGNNLTLSQSDYNEFLSLNNQIAEMFPAINMGMDSNGNAMLALSLDANTLTQSLKELLDTQRQISNKEIADTMPDIVKNLSSQDKILQNNKNKLEPYADKTNEEFQKRLTAFNRAKENIEYWTSQATKDAFKEMYGNDWEKAWREQFGQSMTGMDMDIRNMFGFMDDDQWLRYISQYKTEYDELPYDWGKFLDNFDIDAVVSMANNKLQDANDQISKAWQQLNPIATAWIQTDAKFQTMSEDMQNAVLSMISNFDFSQLDEKDRESADAIKKYIQDNILDVIDEEDTALISKINDAKTNINNAISSNNKDSFKEAKKTFDEIVPDDWLDDKGKIEIKSDDDAITKYIKGIAQQIETDASNYEVRIGFKEDFETSAKSANDTMKNKLQEYQDLVKSREELAASLSNEERYWGNVDQYTRKIIPITDDIVKELKQKGLGEYTKDELGTYMTTFGMQDFVKDGPLTGQQIMFTPILPSGEILDRNTLDKYISEITKNASSEAEVLDADKQGMQIGDTFVQGIINGVTNVNDEIMNPILDSIFKSFDTKNITEYGEDVSSTVSDALITAFGVEDTGAKDEIRAAIANMLQEAVNEAGSDVDVKTVVDSNFQEIATTAKAIQLSYDQHSKQANIYDKEYTALAQVAGIENVKASTLFGKGSGFETADSYIKNARELSDSSRQLAVAYQAIANAFAGSDNILETDEIIDAYKQWESAGFKRPAGADWTEDQYAALQLLRSAVTSYKTDIDTLAQSFVDVGIAVKSIDFDLSETLSDNTTAIDTMQESISNYQSALDKLSSGSATMSDIVDILQQYPKAAKGIKITSKGVEGLYGNLRRAAKAKPKDLINSLEETRKQLQALGKDTSEIDGLITALDQLPSSGVDDLSDQFVTLADGMDAAKEAYGKLQEAMNKNPNVGYETRAEAIDKMKELMEDGQIGSTSELWDIAKAFFGDDPDKFADIANKDADALYELIHAREAWYKTDDDGKLTYEGTESFIKAAEAAFNSSSKLKELGTKWTYDNGELNFDFGNADWDTVVSELSKTKELSGLTSAEFADLIVQVGQYFKLWEDAGDVSTYIKAIADSTEDETVKMEKMTDAVESYYKKMTGENIDLGSLDEAGVKALHLDDDLETLLLDYLKLSDEFKDPLKIEANLEKDGLDGLTKIKELQDVIKQNSDGTTIINTDKFTEVLKEAGYTEGQIDSLIKKIQEYDDVVSVTNDDPLGITITNANLNSVKSTLDQLGIKYQETKGAMNEPIHLDISATDLITELQSKGWTTEQIRSYLSNLTNAENGLGITVDGKVNMTTDEIDAAIKKANEVPENKSTEYTVTGSGENTLSSIQSRWSSVTTPKSTTYSIYETTYKSTVNKGSGKADGTAHANGTAFSSGSWGAPKTETALTGELGPELLVRGNKWITVGENGAEFTQVKRGDIIFNHEQTKQLFENGYVTSRGKAYAEGTAYLKGGGPHKTYTFSTPSSAYKKKSSSSSSNSNSSSTSNNMSDAADSANEFEETFDWLEIKLEEINEQLDLMNAKLENAVGYSAKNTIIDQMLNVNKSKLSTLEKGVKLYKNYSNQLLNEIPSQYREMAKNGSIAITEFAGEADEKTVEAINNYREWAQKVADLTQQMEELKTEISDLAKQKFDNVSDQYDNIITLIENQTEKLDDQVSLMEDRGYVAAKEYYEAMISSTKQQSSELVKEKKALQGVLDQQVKLGNIKKYDERWYEMVDAIYEVDSAIVECTSDLEEYQNAINDIYWDNFDGLTSRLDYLSDETQSLIDLMEDSDKLISTPKDKEFWGEKDVKWTEEGIVSLGLYAQQMEIAEYHSKQYKKAINDLNKDYKDGKYSETEYLDKLNELKSAQYDTIGAYYDAQEAIKDLNETRVDSIKKGIEKEIDAYEELIDKKKEELDSEKDLYDFQKSTMEQQKDISDIQRKLAALSGDNSASAIAKRKQLEADLAEAKSALEESYYDRSIDQRQEALDKELEDFQDEKNAEIEKWEKYLDQIELVVADSLSIVQDNASLVYDTLNEKADEYNLTLSDAILTPWKDGALAVSDYQTVFDTAMSSTTDQLEAMKNKWQEVIDKMSEAAGKEIQKQKEDNKKTTSATYKKPKPATSTPKKNTTSKAKAKKITTGSKINAKGAKIYGYAGGQGYTQYFSSDPIYVVLGEQNGYYKVRYHKASSGVTGWFKKSDVKAYAKGSKGIDKDQWALLDELGPELQLVPDSNGRLAYIQRGTSIIPSDISENLMKLGQLDPQDVLDRNRPQIGVPHITNNEISINMDIAEVVHIDKVTNDTLPDLAKVVEKQMDSYMVKINNSLKKFTR